MDILIKIILQEILLKQAVLIIIKAGKFIEEIIPLKITVVMNKKDMDLFLLDIHIHQDY